MQLSAFLFDATVPQAGFMSYTNEPDKNFVLLATTKANAFKCRTATCPHDGSTNPYPKPTLPVNYITTTTPVTSAG